jgi:hypothetical protein
VLLDEYQQKYAPKRTHFRHIIISWLGLVNVLQTKQHLLINPTNNLAVDDWGSILHNIHIYDIIKTFLCQPTSGEDHGKYLQSQSGLAPFAVGSRDECRRLDAAHHYHPRPGREWPLTVDHLPRVLHVLDGRSAPALLLRASGDG